MKLLYYDDGKEKFMSHEIELAFEFNEVNVMEESRKDAVEAIRIKVQRLIDKLVNLDYEKLVPR